MQTQKTCQPPTLIIPDNSNTWMENIPNQLLSELSIPGTHDSCCNLECGVLQTQKYNLTQQLNYGVRFLDIRCRHIENSFQIHHDYFFCDINFDEVLTILKEFLTQFPSECIIMRVKEEFTQHNCSRNFHATFLQYLCNFSDMLFINENIPMLNEVRGKVWLICDFEIEDNFNTFIWKNEKMKIQDLWKICDEEKLQNKIMKIEEHLHNSIYGEKEKLFLNFCSGTGEKIWPEKISEFTNKSVYRFTGRLGIVIFDFPDRKVINYLISQNNHVGKNNGNYFMSLGSLEKYVEPKINFNVMFIIFKVLVKLNNRKFSVEKTMGNLNENKILIVNENFNNNMNENIFMESCNKSAIKLMNY
jgi:1-phosphatidylinositol phosphodiesterase